MKEYYIINYVKELKYFKIFNKRYYLDQFKDLSLLTMKNVLT